MNVIEKINYLRIAKGWSVYTLALEAGITQSTLASMIARNTPPKIETLESICEAFGITLAQFFAEDEHFEYLNDLETKLLQHFRSLSMEKQKLLVDFLKQS